MFEPLLIHNNNTILSTRIVNKLSLDLDKLDFENSDLDAYITNNIIPLIKEKNFNILFIKDNLSQNYIELYGILLTYHIRLSSELGDKQFVPIVIISELDGYVLNKIEPTSNILFTKNIFIGKNDLTTYDYYKNIFDKLESSFDLKQEFLDKIHVEQPKDYLSHHSIVNEWAIYRWAKFLGIDSKAIQKNQNKISSMLYFKYLIAKNPLQKNTYEKFESEKLKEDGKILFIDDEWNKGWSDILKKIFYDKLETFKYENYKDVDKNDLFTKIEKKVKQYNPDVVVLDLRLAQNDHDKDTKIEDYTGIKILQMIHSINAGIQVIMLTATSKSIILEKLYEYQILGYIKKEHPDDISIDTEENIDKLVELVHKGLKNSYLKKIWITNQQVQQILKKDPFSQYIDEKKQYEINLGILKRGNEHIFDILNSDKENKFNYAMVSIATSLEAIINILFKTTKSELVFWDNERSLLNDRSRLEDKVNKLLKKLGFKENIDSSELILYRNNYMHSNPKKTYTTTKQQIGKWFNNLSKIIEIIDSPPDYIVFDVEKDKIEREKKRNNVKCFKKKIPKV